MTEIIKEEEITKTEITIIVTTKTGATPEEV